MKKQTTRCPWPTFDDPLYLAYHDEEWGKPCHEDRKHFEFLVLESAQAGLSWLTILKRREGYRRAFAKFDPAQVALFDEAKVQELCTNAEIIRNERKIRAHIHNAKLFLQLQAEFGSFDAYIWNFVGGKTVHNRWRTLQEIPVQTPESEALSKDFKKRGFRFLGPVVMYAHMQALGLVSDHTAECFVRNSGCRI